jgi:hypothetical protein
LLLAVGDHLGVVSRKVAVDVASSATEHGCVDDRHVRTDDGRRRCPKDRPGDEQ